MSTFSKPGEEAAGGFRVGRSVLVMGGTGFIGAHLVRRLLKAGAEVRIVDNLSRPSSLPLLGTDLKRFLKNDSLISGVALRGKTCRRRKRDFVQY